MSEGITVLPARLTCVAPAGTRTSAPRPTAVMRSPVTTKVAFSMVRPSPTMTRAPSKTVVLFCASRVSGSAARAARTRSCARCMGSSSGGNCIMAPSTEAPMRVLLCASFLLAAAPAVAQQTVPDIQFDSSADFLKLPGGTNFGEVPGVAVNSKGHVFVFTRSNSAGGPAYAPTAAQLLEFGPKGEFIREIGKGLYGWSFAHSVRIDKDDNIWAIDKGSDMVIKFDQNGRVQMVFGRKVEGADEEAKPWEHPDPPLAPLDGLFRQPTDVTWDTDGNIYITD